MSVVFRHLEKISTARIPVVPVADFRHIEYVIVLRYLHDLSEADVNRICDILLG